ncbi:Gfo/Idh/MocA family protein [Clostridium sp. M14]|uniref:Gfo/Idh/MocA family protein n=1 Tax=Clostridium sp. M14 TaxID=2716311 RepID=UPI0013EE6475|nr:Gfo/Idh/MocA family oxidoreductase [Clostridium sp. M14]MBZ9690456.1 Gfo/Idh/MocA family oxidoreductase [Clostridium sp. M14]
MKKIINLGVIGSGAIAENFLDAASNFKNLNFHTFYSRNEDTAKKFKNKYNFYKASTSLNEMSKDKELDAVYIASPNALHHDHAILFLENKKHVLCEKAFASNYAQALNIINTAKKNNVVIMEAMRLTCLPNFINVKNSLHKIGKIRRYFANYCQYSSRYDKFKEGIIMNAFKKELSNGSLMDIGIYCLSPMINLFGKPQNIKCNTLFLSNGVDGQGSSILDYGDMDAVILYSKIANSNIPSEIQGEKGSIIIDKINTFKNVKLVYNDGTIENLSENQYDNDMYYEIEEFVKLINSSDVKATYSSLNTLDNTLDTISTMDSMRNKLDIVFPADNI